MIVLDVVGQSVTHTWRNVRDANGGSVLITSGELGKVSNVQNACLTGW